MISAPYLLLHGGPSLHVAFLILYPSVSRITVATTWTSLLISVMAAGRAMLTSFDGTHESPGPLTSDVDHFNVVAGTFIVLML